MHRGTALVLKCLPSLAVAHRLIHAHTRALEWISRITVWAPRGCVGFACRWTELHVPTAVHQRGTTSPAHRRDDFRSRLPPPQAANSGGRALCCRVSVCCGFCGTCVCTNLSSWCLSVDIRTILEVLYRWHYSTCLDIFIYLFCCCAMQKWPHAKN